MPQDLALKTDSIQESVFSAKSCGYNNELLQAPPSASGTGEINSLKKDQSLLRRIKHPR